MALSGSQRAYLPARLGLARLGASRLNSIGYFAFNQGINIGVTIGGTPRQVLKQTLQVTETYGQAATATMRVRGFTPTKGQTVYIWIGQATNRVFGGRIVGVKTVFRSRESESAQYDIRCLDWTWDLDRKLVTQHFAAQSATDLIRSLLSTYTSGFTSVKVQSGLETLTEKRYRFKRVSECFDDIALDIGGQWYIDPDKDVHFYVGTEAGVVQPQALTTNSTWEWHDLGHDDDMTDVRTRVYAEGGGARLLATRTASELGSWYDNTAGLTTRGPATGSANDAGLYVDSEVFGFGASDRVLVDESLYRADTSVAAYDALTVSIDTIGTVTSSVAVGATTIPVSTLTGLPPASGSTQKGVVVIDGQTIFYTDTTGGGSPSLDGIPASGEGSVVAAIASGADVIVPAYLQIDDAAPGSEFVAQTHQVGVDVRSVRVRNDSTAQTNLAALDGSDGVREGYVRDNSDSYLSAAATGDAELAAYADPVVAVRYVTRDINTKAGRDVQVTIGSIDDTFRIQRVVISGFEQSLYNFPLRVVEASSRRFGLVELLKRVQKGQGA